ncbi:hypothetical protein ASD19_10845 [Microbacterium sp. Root53]|uniref:WhiB family transcriptional regulator n=1 Tax=Microbacterium sp. Root53 TaxID=1736553 RepID=UPI0006F66DB4|nr:WhiB family transcriptional regulator [Microbacterium sp. Root53]KQZ10042.1 hypothetical protein ASD19_10845 [Microbacterium sp. Root53]
MSLTMRAVEAEAWKALDTALQATRAPCAGDNAFIQDTFTEDEKTRLRAICGSCPIVSLCDDYARHVTAGFWAGKQRGFKKGNS